MYDIFDDIFDDGYGYNDYGMSDTDVDVELAFEAAMGAGTDYEYDYATEGFRDAMGKIGTKIADSARNMVRKIGEMFGKIKQWIVDRLAPLRAKSASGDNKTLQQVLKALDRQVANASGPRKAEVKQKVARVKRAIMQAIDGTKRRVDTINRGLSDGVAVFKAAQSIGQSFIEKLNAAVASGSEKGNTDDGNDLVDKMNSLERRYTAICTAIKSATEGDDDEQIMEILKSEMPGGTDRLTAIIKAIKFDKIDFRAIFAAEAQLKTTCTQGEDAAKRLEKKLDNKYMGYKANGNVYDRVEMDVDKKNRFDADSRENLSALLNNWRTFTAITNKLSEKLGSWVDVFNPGTQVTFNPKTFKSTWGNSDLYDKGIRTTGRRAESDDLPETHYPEPTSQQTT